MKLRFLPLLFAASAAYVVFSANSNGRGAAGHGNTGAPGETTTCQGCHGTNIAATVTTVVNDASGTAITAYNPETTYDVVVTVNGSGARYGFQCISMKTTGNVPLNTSFSNAGSNVKFSTVTSTSRKYAEHNGASTTNTFTFKWTAPVAGSGDVKLYTAGIAANGNGQDSGDGANKNIVTLTEANVGTTAVVAQDFALNVYPNPATDLLNLSFNNAAQEAFTAEIFDVTGNVFQSVEVSSNATNLNVSNMAAGLYFVRLKNAKGFQVMPFVKM